MDLTEKVARELHHLEAEPHKSETGYGDVWHWEDVMPAVRERHLTAARAAIAVCAEEMAAMVEHAFKEGLWIGENVFTTPDLAWRTSKVRADLAAAIRSMGEKGE